MPKRFQLVKLIEADAQFNQTDDLYTAAESAKKYLEDTVAEGVFYLLDPNEATAVTLVASRKSKVTVKP